MKRVSHRSAVAEIIMPRFIKEGTLRIGPTPNRLSFRSSDGNKTKFVKDWKHLRCGSGEECQRHIG